ncbi:MULTISPECIES: DUF1350 family protein [unclassified Prochlorococcus]|uniref:DUF1350 family protein n=1 Tax=unclassified Prochlorococcus TaxID=2627481 RepID=UPI000533906C|nr:MULTISPECIES: DUF1350 family protein [unclassified Prochlorococcus]KGG15091.1 Alpha/beta hydrolase [Prochlorococcus sp. MIT 0602]KGG17363.1 Alpha/beta hydrolase [Prochlorococcus sp. MIT 0603]
MARWRKVGQTWCNWPPQPKELIEMIGGSYLAAAPNISYQNLLNGLIERNFAIHAWSYVPSFDHQTQANKAWKELRECRLKLEERLGGKTYQPIRLGHSLGCKLHLISPDRGRRSKLFIGISFNNYKADKSIPMLKKFKRKLDFETEFSPSPKETLNLIYSNYIQSKNLLIRFKDDAIDQTDSLLNILKSRDIDQSTIIELEGNHLTPTSRKFNEIFLEKNTKNIYKGGKISTLIDTIYKYIVE